MTLHTCPHCNWPGLYSAEAGQQVNCRSCGAAFVLSRLTRTEKGRLQRAYELTKLKAQNLRTSRRLVYAGGGLGVVLLVWLGLSVFGVIPDEARLINRRFASASEIEQLNRTVGLIAIPVVNEQGAIALQNFFSAAVITTDGFMLTSSDPVEAGRLLGTWVLLDGRRYQAQVVPTDSLGDFALLKLDGDLPLKLKISHVEELTRLNQEILAVGRQTLAEKVDSPVDLPLSVTRGTISRVFVDKLGTEWIEHSAAIGRSGGTGGPLLLGDTIIGINIETDAGISRAVSVLPHRERIDRAIKRWKQEQAESP